MESYEDIPEKWGNEFIPESEIQNNVSSVSVEFAKKFGKYLAVKINKREPLTTSQLRKFFGEIKRQQMMGYNEASFVMLKPKLAYAVGRAKNDDQKKQFKDDQKKQFKIEDFYNVMCPAIDSVVKAPNKEKAFKNFISIFEAIVAYHKQYEGTKIKFEETNKNGQNNYQKKFNHGKAH